ncbi:MAG: phosphatidate cytidylyltransferase [Pirellulaceae bacterium]|nr:phosphatidate cytidylyltransferase [Pirellulaceae bacterium]
MLRWRLISAACILAPIFVLLHLDFFYNFGAPGIWLAPVALLLGILATEEVIALFKAQNLLPAKRAIYPGVILILFSALVPIYLPLFDLELQNKYTDLLPMWALAAGLILAFAAEMRKYTGPGGVIVKVALAIFPMIYIAGLMVFLIKIRLLGGNAQGMGAMLALCVVVKMSDVGAYTFGRLFGKNKMAPKLSPGKTLEGALGGLFLAAMSSYFIFYLVIPYLLSAGEETNQLSFSWWIPPLYGVIISAIGMIGDLSESLLKRDMQQKESGRFIPGLGGILDILDSILMAAPVAFGFWVLAFGR